MTRTLSLAIVSALLLPLAVRAQSTPPAASNQAAQPSAKPGFENDPAFKNLPPDEQAWIRSIRERLGKAIADQDAAAIEQIQREAAEHRAKMASPVSPVPTAKPAQPSQTGCAASPVKKPGFHIPKPLQDAINKQTKQVGKQTGVDLDPNAASQAVKDAQKDAPCLPAASAPGQTAKPTNK
jgi:hypothetical protein